MSKVNILKQVKVRAAGEPKPKRQRAAAKKAAVVQIKFNVRKPYEYFAGRSAADVHAAIGEVFKISEDFYGKTELLTVLNKVKATVPMSLLDLFFTTARRNGPEEAFAAVTDSPEYVEMRNILRNRAIEQNTSVAAAPRTTAPKSLELLNIAPAPKNRELKLLTYSRQELQHKSINELYDLANSENLKVGLGLTKSELINRLLTLERSATEYKERPFTTDLLPRCESEYRQAPWMRAFGNVSVVGIALKRGNGLETNVNVQDDWYTAKASWYFNVCRNGRRFEPNAVAYIAVANGKKRIIVETHEMYEASLDRARSAPAPSTRVGVSAATKPPTKPATANIPLPTYKIVRPEARLQQPELAPELFRFVRELIAGTKFCCNNCNKSVPFAKIGSIDENKKVIFCSTECFNDYEFNTK